MEAVVGLPSHKADQWSIPAAFKSSTITWMKTFTYSPFWIQINTNQTPVQMLLDQHVFILYYWAESQTLSVESSYHLSSYVLPKQIAQSLYVWNFCRGGSGCPSDMINYFLILMLLPHCKRQAVMLQMVSMMSIEYLIYKPHMRGHCIQYLLMISSLSLQF